MNYNELRFCAHGLAKNCFEGVVDKAGAPYFRHCIAVADGAYAVADALGKTVNECDSAWIAGMLHDVVEDSDVTVESIERIFGPLVAQIVDNVSKRPGESRRQYFSRVFSHEFSMIVKFADSNHNSQLNRIKNPTPYMVKKCAGYAKFNVMLGEKLGLV